MTNNSRHALTILKHFIKTYPGLSLLVLMALLTAGIAEIIGVSALLPLLNVFLQSNEAQDNVLTILTNKLFEFLGLEVSFKNLLALIVIAICLKAFVIFQAMKIVAFAAADITRDMRMDLMNALMGARWQYYTTLPVGKLSNAISTEAESAGHFYTLIGKTIAWSIQSCVYIGIAFVVDFKVSLCAILMGGLAAFGLKFLIKMARNAGESYTHSLNSLLARLSESLNGAKPLKAMAQETRFTSLLRKDTDDINSARRSAAVSSISLNAIQEPLLVIFIAVGLFVMFEYANYPVTELLLIAFLFYRLIGYANQVQASYQKAIVFESAVNSILNETEAAQEAQEQSFGNKTPSFDEAIAFQNVTIGYDDHVVCENFSDAIHMRKFNVVFGPSGIGKSTLLDSVMGFMTVKAGTITIDNINIEDIDLRQLRQSIGYVPQETYLFHDTILKNVTLGDETISEEDAIAALKLANAWDFVSDIDDGLSHVVGERGGKLSGGQRQRIALARALVRDPEILILDEATTGLDKESETLILSALKEMSAQKTIIAVSHDPKILEMADHVIHLQKGDN